MSQRIVVSISSSQLFPVESVGPLSIYIEGLTGELNGSKDLSVALDRPCATGFGACLPMLHEGRHPILNLCECLLKLLELSLQALDCFPDKSWDLCNLSYIVSDVYDSLWLLHKVQCFNLAGTITLCLFSLVWEDLSPMEDSGHVFCDAFIECLDIADE